MQQDNHHIHEELGTISKAGSSTLKDEHPTDYPKKQGVNIEIIDPLEEIKNENGNTASDLARLSSSIYKRTKGAAGIEGQLCEISLSMLLLLKGITDEQIGGFYLASNMEKADKFDDIVFKYEYKSGLSKIVFLQAKHKTDQKGVNINNLFSDSGDFSLKKYFISYRKIKQQFSDTKCPIFSSNFEDSEFVIYTNAPFVNASIDNSVKIVNIDRNDFLRISDSQSKYYQLEFNGNRKERIVNLLKDSSDSRRLARELVRSIYFGEGIDMQKDIFQSYHIALQKKVIEKTNDKLEGKLRDYFLNEDENSSPKDKVFRRVFLEEAAKVFEERDDELKQKLQNKVIKLSNKFGGYSGSENLKLPNDDPVAEDEIKDFLKKFKLFAGQPSEKDLEKVIKHKVKEVYRVEQQDIDSVFSDVEYKVRKWWQNGDNYLEKDNKFFDDAVRVSINFDVKQPVTFFTGRIRELQELHNILQKGGGAVISQMVSVTGLGGIGKSELARKYISEHNKDYDNNIVWINADNYLTIAGSFRRLAQDKLRISMVDENNKEKEIKLIVEDVYSFFEKRHRRSLFVFDNAGKHTAIGQSEEAEGVDKYLPSGPNKPHVLITSRDQEWGQIKSISLDVFTEEEAVEFIRNSLKIEEGSQKSEIKNLGETLHRLPLALQQAVAYINSEIQGSGKWINEKFTINNYLELYKKKPSKLLNERSSETYDRYTKTVLTTWQITIDKIKQKKVRGGEQALEILDIMAYLAPDKIPIDEIFSKLIDNEELRHSAVELLDQYSMANLDGGKVNIHRLVQQVTRIELEGQGEEKKVIQKTFELLGYSFPYGKDESENCSRKKELIPHLEVFSSHINDWLKKEPEGKQKIEESYFEGLLIWMADGYFNLGNPGRQKELLEQALPIFEKHYGLEHFTVAKTLGNLGNAYGALGDHQKQKELLEWALKIQEKHYGLNHFEVAGLLVNLGSTYGALGDHPKQEELLERALKIQEKHYGPKHFAVAITLVNLGIACGALGDHQKQKDLLKRALKIQEKHYGPEHFTVAGTLGYLNHAYGVLGDHQKQKELLERAWKIQKKHYGSEHFEVAGTLVNLGNTYGALGDHHKQKEFLEGALKIQKKHYGSEYFKVAGTLGNLGNAYGALGDHQKQRKLLEQALKLQEKHYGPKHFAVAATLGNLGNAYGALGDHQKQKDLLERALKIQEKLYGPEYFAVAITLVNLGIAYDALGDHRKQKNLLERALKIQEKHYGPDYFSVAITLTCLGNVYYALGDQQKQKDLLERALKIQEKNYGLEYFAIAITLTSLGNVYYALGDHQKQKELLERALKINEKYYGPEHFEVSGTLINLGNTYGTLGDHQKQKELLERALEIHEKHYGTEHVEVAGTLVNLCNAYRALDDHQKQKELLERALKIHEKHYGTEHVEVGRTLVNLGNAYRASGDHQKQKELLERVLKIQEKHYGPEHFEVAGTLGNLGIAYGALRDHQKQKELLERALKIQEKHNGPEHVAVAIILVNLSLAHWALRDNQKQKELLDHALKIQEKYYGPEHFEIAGTLIKLGIAYEALGDYQKQMELLERALKIQEKHYGPDHFEVSVTLVMLGNAYKALGKHQKQKELLEQALPNFERCNHPVVTVLRRALDELVSLHFAFRNGNLDLIKILIKEGSDVLARDSHDTVLHQAVSSGNEEVIRLILEKIKEKDQRQIHESINAKDMEKNTPLMWAAEKGKKDAARILLEYGADLNAQNNDGETALHWAIKGGYQDFVQLLLKKQADPNIQENNSKTALEITKEKLDQDPENENLKAIMGLLLSVDESQHKGEQGSVL